MSLDEGGLLAAFRGCPAIFRKSTLVDDRTGQHFYALQALRDAGVALRATDPECMAAARAVMGEVTYRRDGHEAAESADAVAIVTEWDQLRALDLPRRRAFMAEPVVMDLHNVYTRDEAERAGFRYYAVGR